MTDERVERRLAAILAADVAGYSRLMGIDEVGTLAALKSARREVVDPAIAAHRGRIFKTMGDGVLVEFASAVDAVTCAMAVQAAMSERDSASLKFRIGINVGDIIIDSEDIFGDGVNVAARVEAECEPGGLCLSSSAFEQVRGKTSFIFDDLGYRSLKNIERPVRLYAVTPVTRPQANQTRLERERLPLPDKPSIAVLPFQNMSGDPEQEYFADGIVEDMITELSRFKGLLVIARNSTFTYKSQAVDIKKVGAQLGVKYVLEGSVRKAGARVRVTVQLIEAQTSGHVWAERYDRELTDIFELQDEITRTVVATLQTEMILREGNLAEQKGIARDFNAWSISKKAWQQFYELTQESLTEARTLASVLLKLDPRSPEGYKLLSSIISHIVYMGFSEQRELDIDEARQSAHAALRLNHNDEHSNWALGIILGFFDEDYSQAEAALRRAIEINPNFSLGYGTLGTILAYAGRANECIDTTTYAMRLNPRDPSIFFRYNALSIAYFLLSDYDQALKWSKLSVERKSDFWVSQALVTACLFSLGRIEEATISANALLKISPTLTLHALPIEPVRPQMAKQAFHDALQKAGIPSR